MLIPTTRSHQLTLHTVVDSPVSDLASIPYVTARQPRFSRRILSATNSHCKIRARNAPSANHQRPLTWPHSPEFLPSNLRKKRQNPPFLVPLTAQPPSPATPCAAPPGSPGSLQKCWNKLYGAAAIAQSRDWMRLHIPVNRIDRIAQHKRNGYAPRF